MAKRKKYKKKRKEKVVIQVSAPKAQVSAPEVKPYPQAGQKVTEFEDKLDQQLAGEAEQLKRGPGRPRKQAEPEPEPSQFDLQLIANAIKMPFDVWAKGQQVPELKLKDQEAMQLAKPVKDLLDYYLPKVPAIAFAWISLAITSYSVTAPRLEILAKIRKQKQSQSITTSSKPAGGEGTRSSPPATNMGFPSAEQLKTEVV